MLISKRNRFIFFHVPKVAGSSITKAFRRFSDYPIERVYNYMIDYIGKTPKLNLYNMHITPAELRTHMKKDNFQNYFKFAFVRNPFDWHVSQYMYHKQKTNAFFHDVFKNMGFHEYVDWAIKEENIVKANASQKVFLSDENGNILVDFVGKFENLESDFNYITKKLGIGAELPKVNPSKRVDDYKTYYNEELIEKISTAFKDDIEYFDYAFDGI